MGDVRRARCKECHKHRDEVGVLSWRGYCGPCGKHLATQAAAHLHYHEGEKFTDWRRGMAASVGAVLVDDILNAE